MARLPVVSWIGNAAAALLGNWGEVSKQAEEAGCSRQTVYDHGRKVQQAVTDYQEGQPTRDELVNENSRLRAEHGRPVLVGVEPHSMACVLCLRTADRQGKTWYQALQPWSPLE